ncbi:MAG: NAD-dependent epimerase/dehydratase family protein, partial [Puniceicoccales bacterium]|nr:NAD-dependent epimerase/dehydratase family protein [Puniceicoccales bacterium]
MKVLVTGGNGFLGQRLLPLLLKRGLQVRVLGRQERGVTNLPVEYRRGDIQNFSDVLGATCGVEAVFHLASRAGIESHPQLYDVVNVKGTDHVLEACRQNHVSYCIYTSSPCVVFNGRDIRHGDESLPYSPHPLCDYARTKIQAERLVLAANSPSLRTMALRPHLLFGRGDRQLIPRLLQRSQNGQLAQIGAGKNHVDMTHIDNAAQAHELALLAFLRGHAGGKAYFIGQERPLPLWETIDEILRRLGHPPVTRRIPYSLAYASGYALEKLSRLRRNHPEPAMTRFLALALG